MSIPRNVVWGIRGGVAFAGIYSLWVVGLYLFRGSAPFENQGTTLLEVLAAYWFGGAVAGGLVGLLRPLVRWRLGAALVGIVAGIPVGLGIVYAIMGISPWTGEHTFVLAWISVVAGSIAGIGLRAIFHDEKA